jgi:hypothetical protein
LSDENSTGPVDSGCFTIGDLPDAAPKIYGSCVIGSSSEMFCDEAAGGLTDEVDASASYIKSQICTGPPLNGTWSDGPCSRANAVFGCETVRLVGQMCTSAGTMWFYAPTFATRDESVECPVPGKVVLP